MIQEISVKKPIRTWAYFGTQATKYAQGGRILSKFGSQVNIFHIFSVTIVFMFVQTAWVHSSKTVQDLDVYFVSSAVVQFVDPMYTKHPGIRH